MNGIIGMNQLLRDSELTPHQRFYADTIHDSSGALLRIIDSILDLSKLEAGKVSLEIAPFDLHELIDQSLAAFSPAAEAKGLTLTGEVALGHPALFQGDSAILRQVLLNLVANAIKFTEAGSVTIAASGTVASGVAASSDTRLRIEVRDTGIGIAEAARAKLFNPFEQADNTITRRFGGTGLGLSISKRLVELMGGRIGVEANRPHGSVFWFELFLPRAAGLASSEPAIGEDEAPKRQGSGHILVAEDNRINATVATAFLTAGGYTCDLAADGLEAIAAIRARHYDLVLMDVQMPKLDGLSATREIRALPEGATLPIVAMTANAMKEDRDRCLAAGMDDYMAKPLDRATLYQILSRWIDRGEDRPQT